MSLFISQKPGRFGGSGRDSGFYDEFPGVLLLSLPLFDILKFTIKGSAVPAQAKNGIQ